jgi:hypothetical protein
MSFRRRILLKALMLFDLFVLGLSFALAAIPVSRLTGKVSFLSFLSMRIKVQNILLLLALMLGWHFVLSMFGLYESKRLADKWSVAKDVLKAISLGTVVVIVAALLFRIRMVTPIFIFVFWVLSTAISISWRLLLRSFLKRVRSHGRNLRQMLIIGTNPRAVRFARSIEGMPELGYRLVGFVDEQWAGIKDFLATGYSFATDLDRFPIFLRDHVIDEVALALPMRTCYPKASEIVAQCKEQGILVRFLPDIFDVTPTQSSWDVPGHNIAIPVYADHLEGWPIVAKRLLDILVSLTLLIVFSPFFLIVALLIKLENIREKRADANIHFPQLKFNGRCSSPLRKRIDAGRFFFFNFFTCLPKKQIRTDRGAENCNQHRPFISGMRHRRHQGIAHHLAPISPHHKRGYRVGEQNQHQPLEHVRDLVIAEPNRCPRNEQCENHYKPAGVDSGQHFRCVRHTGEVCRDVNRVGRKQGHDENTQQPLWKSLTKIPGQALPCHHSDSGTHHLNRGHQRPRQECSPEKLGSKLCARNRIGGNARWVIVGRSGDNARAKRLQQQSRPSSWGECRHERVGAQLAYESRLGSAHNPTWCAVQIARSDWSNVIRHPSPPLLS